jgi:putative Mg2+ transporter-C (MgtC) family protein
VPPTIDLAVRFAVAYLLALPVAWDREHEDRSAGLRTFPLVAIGAAGYVTIAQVAFAGSPDAQSRVLQGLLAGMGFIGGGAILHVGRGVHGTATAAALWSTACIGVASAYSAYPVAILMSVLSFLTLRFMKKWKPEDRREGF